MYRFISNIGLLVMAALISSCNIQEGKTDSPEETVKCFCRAIVSGDLATAESLCDTLSMKDYLESYRLAWEVHNQEDSTILAIAAGILSKTSVEITDVKKTGEKRIVSFCLESNGHNKIRQAIVRKEEGEWKVEQIIDRS